MGQPKFAGYRPGDRIGGDFEVMAAASGGMGQVMLCYCRSKDYFYALKSLNAAAFHQYCKDPAQFRQEVETWIGLGEHPNIVRCYTVQTIDERPFVLAEWIGDDAELASSYQSRHAGEAWFFDWYARLGGRGATARRAAGPPPFAPYRAGLENWQVRRAAPGDEQRWALDVALDICAGLIHIRHVFPGAAHGDLKPPNILLTPQGTAKIADFGLLKALGEPAKLRGSPWHLAPEQWRGEPFDQRADLYALGVILFKLLMGQEPFDSDSGDVLRALHLDAPIPTVSPALRGAALIDDILRGCLAKSPADRFAAPQELYGALAGAYAALYGVFKLPPHAQEASSIEEKNQTGVARAWLGQYTLGEELLTEALSADSSRPDTYINRAVLRLAAGRYADARRDLEGARRLAAGAARGPAGGDIESLAQYNAALVYYAQGNYARALEEIEEADDHAEASVTRAAILIALQRYGDAIAACTQALTRLPGMALAHYNRGVAFACLGRHARAAAEFGEASPGLQAPQRARWGDAAWLRGQARAARPLPCLAYGRSVLTLMLEAELQQQYARKRHLIAHDNDLPLLGLRVREAAFADEVHPAVQARAGAGELIAQLRVSGEIAYLMGGSAEQERAFIYTPLRTPLPADIRAAMDAHGWQRRAAPADRPEKEFSIIIDAWTQNLLRGAGVSSIAGLIGCEVQLAYLDPHDRMHPLAIYNVFS